VLNVSRSAAWRSTLVLLTCILIVAMSSACASRKKAPQVGDPAPLFRLPSLGSETEVDLHDLVGSKPIVLFFGSYT
jgi:hypothetical protein